MDAQKEPSEEELKQKIEEYLNGWKRAKADLINYRKDEAKRFEELAKFANWDLTKELITVLDSFAALERNGQGEPRPVATGRDLGIIMIGRQLEDILHKRGLERITVSVGQKFDPAFHESLGEVESDNPSGAIVEEIERGYLLNGRVIRPARVKLAKQK